MKRASVLLLLLACGPKQAPASTEPTAATPEPAAASTDDPMGVAFDAATEWNMSMNGGPELSDAEKEALVEKTAANLKLACDAGNRCACNALQSGNCECPDEPLCAGEVFWFVGSK
jgi:hypothetical protein